MAIVNCRACAREYIVVDGEADRTGRLCPSCRDVSTLVPTVLKAGEGTTTQPPASFEVDAELPRLPGYEVQEILGRGGMGIVYKARQIGLNRVVALKVILVGAHASADERSRFRTEAETVARLQHPNIVQVFELGEWAVPGAGARTPYLALEYCGGGSLDKRLKQGALAPRLTAELVEVLARAIHHAHEQKVIHRDLKPANILFSDNGTPKITDFGLAKKLDEQGHTRSGTVMGTPAYMAPEQAAGKVREMGPATDVYALGAILYECLMGRPAFRGETPFDTMLAVVSQAPMPFDPVVPEGLQAICQRCLRKSPQDRYASARELADDLRRYLLGQRLAVYGGTSSPAEMRSAKGAVVLFGLAATALVLMVAAGAAWWWSPRKNENGSPPVTDGKRSVGNFQPAFRLPDGEPWGLVMVLLQGTEIGGECLSFSPDGGSLAVGRGNGNIQVWDLGRREVRQLVTGHLGDVTSLEFSRDGKHLLSASADGTARIWEVASAKEIQRFGEQTKQALLIKRAVYFDGEREVLTATLTGVQRWEAASGKPIHRLTFVDPKLQVRDMAVRPGTGQLLIAADLEQTGELLLGDVKQDKLVRSFGPKQLPPDQKLHPVCCAFTPDGRLVVSGEFNGQVRLWEADSGKLVDTLHEHATVVKALAISPRGQRALTLDEGQIIHLLDLARRDRESVISPRHVVFGLTFSPDGRHYATVGPEGPVRIWGLPRPKK